MLKRLHRDIKRRPRGTLFSIRKSRELEDDKGEKDGKIGGVVQSRVIKKVAGARIVRY